MSKISDNWHLSNAVKVLEIQLANYKSVLKVVFQIEKMNNFVIVGLSTPLFHIRAKRPSPR
jgi:hypothetical protein